MGKSSGQAWLLRITLAAYAALTLAATIVYLYLDGTYRAYYEIGIAPALDQLVCILPIALLLFAIAPLATMFTARRMKVGEGRAALLGLLAYPVVFVALFLLQFLSDNSYPTPYKAHTLREFLLYLVTKLQ